MAKLIVLAATLLSLAGTAVSANEAADKPKLTARPTTSLDSALTLTSLDEKSAFERSQAAIGKSVGDFVLLNRDGTPVELSKYRGKPLLVNFVYTACFQVCPTTTRNLQKAVAETASVMGPERFNIVTIGFNQPFDSPQAMKDFAARYGLDLPNWEFLSPATTLVADVTQNFGFSYVATTCRLRPPESDHHGRCGRPHRPSGLWRKIHSEGHRRTVEASDHGFSHFARGKHRQGTDGACPHSLLGLRSQNRPLPNQLFGLFHGRRVHYLPWLPDLPVAEHVEKSPPRVSTSKLKACKGKAGAPIPAGIDAGQVALTDPTI
jgi:cytochrome oxidase Cu insertion factor (SCO1/SenC/PrrC family)